MHRPGFKPFLSDEARDAILAEEEQREKDVVARALTEREALNRAAVCAAARVLLLEVIGLLPQSTNGRGFTSAQVIERLGLNSVEPEKATANEGVRILIGELEGCGALRLVKDARDPHFRLAYRRADGQRTWDGHLPDDPHRPQNRHFVAEGMRQARIRPEP